MVGQRWGTEERAAEGEGGDGSTFLLYLRLLLPTTYLHTYAYLHTFFFDYLCSYHTTLYCQGTSLCCSYLSVGKLGFQFQTGSCDTDTDTVRGEN